MYLISQSINQSSIAAAVGVGYTVPLAAAPYRKQMSGIQEKSCSVHNTDRPTD